ncbi:ADP-ribosylglycohydrolase family protein [uncultured Treponema sp.]|uniref:ADP-ribosylglycohydrolase family protein n=1 Tax=uncultured Treponema sp. TaxID=162155 RepID=UPI0025F49340|nr:ADP-ribosylglycohydrolase family protein [uncultured Treponema sp.]
MYGAIIGDRIGQPYEIKAVKTKNFPLFTDMPHFTDDTVMTIAVCDGSLKLLNGSVSLPAGLKK